MPAKKTTIVATFKDGDFIYRTTNLDLKFGWRVTIEHPKYGRSVETGFSSRRDLAEKAARAYVSAHATRTGELVEIAPTVQHDAKAWKDKLTQELRPFRIKYTYRDGRASHIGQGGNQDARWATREEAETRMKELVAAARDGTTYEIVDDSVPAPKKARAKKK